MRILHSSCSAGLATGLDQFVYVALHHDRRFPQSSASGVRDMSFPYLLERVAVWRRYRQTIRELRRLSDRELADIGIDRDEIPVVARKTLLAA